MFFASNSLLETFLNTLWDMMYGKKGGVLMVMIHPMMYNNLCVEQAKALNGVTPSFDKSGKWNVDDFTVQFVRSTDVPLSKVFIIEEQFITTITKNNATDKNTLP